jgi:hypothetical protein
METIDITDTPTRLLLPSRLLLPFTGRVHTLALNHAIQLAKQYHAALVPLALLPVKPGKSVRLESIQQAQDFLEFICSKAKRQGIAIEAAKVSTCDVARSIEAFAGEMDCEAVILFLSNTRGVLLEYSEIQALLERGNCNTHIVLFPGKEQGGAVRHSLHIPLPRYVGRTLSEAKLSRG